MPPVAVGGGGDRLEADRDGAGMREVALRVDVEDLEPVVGGVHRVEVQVVRRERERADLAGLEGDERRGTCYSAARQERERDQEGAEDRAACCHARTRRAGDTTQA